jgi:hypothetical protein
MTFDESFEKLIGHEGGYVNNPRDPGGETKFGQPKSPLSTQVEAWFTTTSLMTKIPLFCASRTSRCRSCSEPKRGSTL